MVCSSVDVFFNPAYLEIWKPSVSSLTQHCPRFQKGPKTEEKQQQSQYFSLCLSCHISLTVTVKLVIIVNHLLLYYQCNIVQAFQMTV